MAPTKVRRTLEIHRHAASSYQQTLVFAAGGYDWSIHYSPSSHVFGCFELCVQLETMGARMAASLAVAVVDPMGMLPAWKLVQTPRQELFYDPNDNYSPAQLLATVAFSTMKTAEIQGYRTVDGLGVLLECTVTVVPKPPPPAALLPASDLKEQLSKMYTTRDPPCDVAFSVEGQRFDAHKLILAMRSSFFKAELYGGMMESRAQVIEVHDTLPSVFEALLRYIYTDDLPCTDGDDGGDDDGRNVTEMLCHLLVAADKYGVDRLRTLCELKLCSLLRVGNLAKLLAFAEDRQCGKLKDACVEFMATSPNRSTKEVVANNEEYAQLRSARPSVVIDALEKAVMFRALYGNAPTMRPTTRTASMCTAEESARITHSFKVIGGMLHRGFGVGNSVRSAAFAAGGYDWTIEYYPDGRAYDCNDHVAVFLELMSNKPKSFLEFMSNKPKSNDEVTVLYDFRLVNQVSGLSSSVFTHQAVFNAAKSPSSGFRKFMKKSDLEALGYLKDDCLEIECDLTILNVDEIDVPHYHSDMVHGLGKLLESEEGADATFKVRGEVFRAHRVVLAMRSPVFRAEFYGPLSDKTKEDIVVVVEDMEPPVFKALLHFIYTDSLPTMDDLDCNEYEEMAKHLLVAADRYGMERMKLMCESTLCSRLSVDKVATILVIADQYHCSKLKDACIRFINFSNRKNAVAASQGYEHLKRACPNMSAEAPRRPGTRTSSACATTETARHTHSFKVVGGVLNNGFGVGRPIRSATFAVGGHRWCILYYPDGRDLPDLVDYVAVFLELISRDREASAAFEFRLVNQTNGVSTLVSKYQMVFNDANPNWGNPKFMKKSDLRASEFLKNNCLEIECDVTVISKAVEIDVPPPDILDSLGKLLGSEEGADITIKVQGEVFRAHKIVLAMRSPVFKAEFYGPAKDNRKRTVAVEDIEPAVFKALLHFVYTDSLPAMDDLDSDKYQERVKHLLVAAYRYGMERMKLVCESFQIARGFVLRKWRTLWFLPIRIIAPSSKVLALDLSALLIGWTMLQRLKGTRTSREHVLPSLWKCGRNQPIGVGVGKPSSPSPAAAAAPNFSSQMAAAPAPERPMTRTSSTHIAETAQGTHAFEVAEESGLGAGTCVTSDTFAVGGHDWRVRFYPRGVDAPSQDYVAVFLDLVSRKGVDVEVQVLFEFRLLDWDTGAFSPMLSRTIKMSNAARVPWGSNAFMRRGLLESTFLQDDRILMECEVTVVKQSLVWETVEVRVPPSDRLLGDLGRLLESAVGADVAFMVKGEVFHAHRIVLSVRSPVFKELLYGSTSETTASLTIDDVEPVVFKALLHFIYMDSLPAMGELDGEKNEELVWHLLVAAEKYAVERMKLICEEILCKQLDGKSVLSTLALADKHHCSGLRDACVEFMRRECPAVYIDILEKAANKRKTASRCVVETDQCTHVFDIAGYSLLKGIGAGKVIRSAAFVAGGCEWCIRFYPDGYSAEDSGGYVAIFLELLTDAEVRALFDFRLVNPATGQSAFVLECRTPREFKAAHCASGYDKFMKKIDLEAAQYLQNDRLVIECNVTVIMGTPAVFITEPFIQVPPSDLPGALGKSLDSGKWSDVTFKVKDEVFHAHKFVLASRSPVLKQSSMGR
ncbi:hypothetical protein U9M48_040327 [Paspalum notatum var. saurae]|uniref:Uncharacterized protein n=1 Tax=Paspalum notatum var. saurae TaxID=547442 RepID=A0AAQ3XE22_PASNO